MISGASAYRQGGGKYGSPLARQEGRRMLSCTRKQLMVAFVWFCCFVLVLSVSEMFSLGCLYIVKLLQLLCCQHMVCAVQLLGIWNVFIMFLSPLGFFCLFFLLFSLLFVYSNPPALADEICSICELIF